MILNSLNEEQKTTINTEGSVLLTACPGSGKTRVIIHRLAHEAEKLGINSKRKIVALTFTVRASEEIFRRLNNMGVLSRNIWTGTIHSFCLEWIIKPYSCYSKELKNGFSIADESFTSDLISDLKVKYKIKPVESINQRIKRDGTFFTVHPNEINLLSEYYQILAERKLIDFELILYHSLKILNILPKVPETLSNLISLICVDEYQDTQDLQYAILSKIVKSLQGKTNIVLVGDTDQAIYTSLGGVSKELKEVETEFEGIKIIELSLKGNYRSNQRLINFYSNFQTKKIQIIAVGKNANEAGTISLNVTINKKYIAEEISRLIQINLDKGIPEDEICVLVPQWWLITSISKKLRILLPDVNFDASGLAPMSKNRENIWYKLSRLFLTSPHPKIYSARYRWTSEVLEEFRNHTRNQIIEDYDAERNLLRIINSIKSEETEGIEYLMDCFNKFLKILNIDYLEYPLLEENWQLFFENIRKRLNDVEFKIPSDIESFKSYYREMTGVVINTCVGVKGEEFETVIAFGLLNGYIPHWNEIFNGNQVEASMKLMYVICSRAKNNLHLISERGRMTANQKNEYVINPHLAEIDFNYDEI